MISLPLPLLYSSKLQFLCLKNTQSYSHKLTHQFTYTSYSHSEVVKDYFFFFSGPFLFAPFSILTKICAFVLFQLTCERIISTYNHNPLSISFPFQKGFCQICYYASNSSLTHFFNFRKEAENREKSGGCGWCCRPHARLKPAG